MISPPISPVSNGYKLPIEAALGLPSNTYCVLAVASARVYHAQLNVKSAEWCYSRLKGRIVFGKNSSPLDHCSNEFENYWFRLVDTDIEKTIWMFQVPASISYHQDRPFFHVFQGRSRRFGFLFEDDDEASVFAKKVIAHTSPAGAAKSRSRSLSVRSKRGPISPSIISAPTPNSFVHVAHVGINKQGAIEASQGVDPLWKAVFNGLQIYGNTIPEHQNFADEFWNDVKKIGRANSSEDTIINELLASKPKRHRTPAPSFTAF